MKDESILVEPKIKISYGCGDFASSMFWKLFSMYLLFFYKDIFGLLTAAGTMFLIIRIFNAINDPMIGAIANRTNTRGRKFRHYLLFSSIPFAIIGIIIFTTPNLSASGKLIYFYVTYTFMMIYTVVNVPDSSLMGVITNDTNVRTNLASFRFIGAFSGGILVTFSANYLILLFSTRFLKIT